MDSNVDVLIIGAGPVGLSLALELSKYGVPLRIIDKKAEATKTSNASVIHPRTLELLPQEVNEGLLKYGRKSHTAVLNVSTERSLKISYESLNSYYNYLLMIPQNNTEEVLIRALAEMGVNIEWNTTLKSFTQNENSATALLTTAKGTETVTAKWLVGCDGYHSTVRDISNIAYKGDDLKLNFIMIDAQLDIEKPFENFTAYQGSPTLIIVPFLNKVRFIAEVSHSDPEFQSKELPDEKLFTKICSQYFPKNFTIHKPLWASRFYIHERLAESFRKGRVMLIGDAAHTHSPAGGHGMNGGIQDAVNLAWKLSYHLNHKANGKLIDSFEVERRTVAARRIKGTHLQTKLMTMSNKPLRIFISYIMSALFSLSIPRKKLLEDATGISINYRTSPITVDLKHKSVLKSGDRMPNIVLEHHEGKQLKNLLSKRQYTLLDFSFSHIAEKQPLSQLECLSTIKILKDENKLRNLFGFFNKEGYCLIRPDNYIAYIGKDIMGVAEHFNRIGLL